MPVENIMAKSYQITVKLSNTNAYTLYGILDGNTLHSILRMLNNQVDTNSISVYRTIELPNVSKVQQLTRADLGIETTDLLEKVR